MMHSLRTTTLLLALVAVASSFAPITANASLDEAMAIRNHQNLRARRNTVNSIVSDHGSALRRKRQLQASQELAARQVDGADVELVDADVDPVEETDETDASDETDPVDEADEDDEEEEDEEDEEDSGAEGSASPTAAPTAAPTPTGDSNSTLTTNSTLTSNSTTAAPTNGTSTASSPSATITLTSIINHVAIVNDTSTVSPSESTTSTETPTSTGTETEISTEHRTSTHTTVHLQTAAPSSTGKTCKNKKKNKNKNKKNKKQSTSTSTSSNGDSSETTTSSSNDTSETPNTTETTTSSSGSGLLSGASDIVENGQITYFAVGLGACGYTDQDSDFIVALPVGLWNAIGGANVWQGNKVCDKKIKISNGSKAIEVTVRDQCPTCDNNHLDLSPSAFSALANLEQGLVSVSWGWVGGQP